MVSRATFGVGLMGFSLSMQLSKNKEDIITGTILKSNHISGGLMH